MTSIKLSFIVPAFNEEKELPSCLSRINRAIDDLKELSPNSRLESEIIVVDNNSTDETATLATSGGATVVFEPFNQISRARNAGAREASGKWLLFIDADSHIDGEHLRELVERINSKRFIGGGCIVRFDTNALIGRLFLWIWTPISCVFKFASGSFLLCRRDAFEELGGFSQEIFAAEEIEFSRRLKGWAKPRDMGFFILTSHPFITSGRKWRIYSFREIFIHVFRSLFATRSTIRDRNKLPFFYDGRR